MDQQIAPKTEMTFQEGQWYPILQIPGKKYLSECACGNPAVYTIGDDGECVRCRRLRLEEAKLELIRRMREPRPGMRKDL